MSINPEVLPSWIESARWAEAQRLVDADVMRQARATYKLETGKACNNFAMRRCLEHATYNLLTSQGWTP